LIHFYKRHKGEEETDMSCLVEPLSTPQPEFEHARGSKFEDCLLLHRLLIEGKGEEVLRRRQELSLSILKHTCQDPFSSKMTALHLAAEYKSSVPVVSALLEAGSDPNVIDSDQSSALHWAAMDNPQIIPVMIKHGAEVNLLDEQNRSPLFVAAVYNNRDAVVALCNAGGDPRLGYNPLTDSSVNRDIKDIIKSICK
jgi:ankyrin repeat protein